MKRSDVAVIATGVGNTASVAAALRRCDANVVVTADAKALLAADRVVLPGVGTFAAGMAALHRYGLVEVIRQRIDEGAALLAICLGMQLLFESSDESPEVEGLGVVEGKVERFGTDVRVPQFGWNLVRPLDASSGGDQDWAYFANSFCVRKLPEGWSGATSVHGREFVASMWQDGVLACQFHPELSGQWGQGLIRSWLESGKVGVSC